MRPNPFPSHLALILFWEISQLEVAPLRWLARFLSGEKIILKKVWNIYIFFLAWCFALPFRYLFFNYQKNHKIISQSSLDEIGRKQRKSGNSFQPTQSRAQERSRELSSCSFPMLGSAISTGFLC